MTHKAASERNTYHFLITQSVKRHNQIHALYKGFPPQETSEESTMMVNANDQDNQCIIFSLTMYNLVWSTLQITYYE